MPGFVSSISNDEEIVFAENADFSGDADPSQANGLQTDGQLWIGTTTPNAGGTQINVGEISSPDNSVTVGYSSPNITLQVAGGSTVVTKLTPDFDFDGTAATQIAPQAGNINVLTYNPSPTNTFTNSVVASLNSDGTSAGNLKIENRSWTTQYIVDSSTTVGSRGTYSTIASAYAAAKSAGSGTIFIRAGTYTENLAMDTANVNLCAYNCDGQSQTARVIIKGKITVTYSGSASISGCFLQTNGDNYISLTGGSASKLYLYNCSLNANDATGLSQNRSSSYIFCQNCTFVITAVQKQFDLVAGSLYLDHCTSYNWGFDATSSTASGGVIYIWDSVLQFIITTSGTNSFEMLNSEIRGNNTVCLTCGGSGENFIKNGQLLSGTAASISVGSNIRLQNVALDTTNANTITGAGTVEWSNLSFSDICAINATTQTPLLTQVGAVKVTSPGAYPYTAVPQDHVIFVDTSSARTINLNASPQTGQIYRIKDNVGSAGTNAITVTPAAGNIDGAASYSINVNYGSVDVVYSGSAWFVL